MIPNLTSVLNTKQKLQIKMKAQITAALSNNDFITTTEHLKTFFQTFN